MKDGKRWGKICLDSGCCKRETSLEGLVLVTLVKQIIKIESLVLYLFIFIDRNREMALLSFQLC